MFSLSNYIRVLRLTTKPKKDEFFTVAKITGLAMVVIGLVGYLILSIKWIFS